MCNEVPAINILFSYIVFVYLLTFWIAKKKGTNEILGLTFSPWLQSDTHPRECCQYPSTRKWGAINPGVFETNGQVPRAGLRRDWLVAPHNRR